MCSFIYSDSNIYQVNKDNDSSTQIKYTRVLKDGPAPENRTATSYGERDD